MKYSKTILVVSTSVLAVAGVCWFAFLPYPLAMRLDARKAVRYSPQWPISQADYAAARRVAQADLGFYEIIERVNVMSGTKIQFWTLQRWSGPLASAGQEFIVEKLGGRWSLTRKGFWLS